MAPHFCSWMTERVLCPFKYCFFNRPFYVQGTSGEKMSFIWAIGGILLELIWFIGSFSHGLWMIERILCFCLNNIMMIWIRCDPPLLSITVWCSLSVTYWSLFTLDNKITPPSPTQWSNLNNKRWCVPSNNPSLYRGEEVCTLGGNIWADSQWQRQKLWDLSVLFTR